MKLTKLECPNCHAPLDLDFNHLQAYCPYCGNKLLFDLDQINFIIAEKEKTNRFSIKQKAEIEKNKVNKISEIVTSSNFEFVIATFIIVFLSILALIIVLVETK